jgi:hypothetical protein
VGIAKVNAVVNELARSLAQGQVSGMRVLRLRWPAVACGAIRVHAYWQ